jgi:hypothetical protein
MLSIVTHPKQFRDKPIPHKKTYREGVTRKI